jgi:Family of unknown function (DUF6765)
MQKDVHFYLTYVFARKVGFPEKKAEIIAWSNQYTDDLTEADLHGIQTQSGILGNWGDTQVQFSVLVPFHFIPGADEAHPWMTTRNSPRARQLVESAMEKDDLYQMGVALHGLQDTFSHEKFSGWREDLNSCFPWYYLESSLPNVGHAEMRVIPDVVNYVWTDPRDGTRIDNRKRTMRAAKVTFDYLADKIQLANKSQYWQTLEPELRDIFKLESYDKRVDELCVLSGNDKIDYNKANKKYSKSQAHKKSFVMAAGRHLSQAMRLFEDLPWLT